MRLFCFDKEGHHAPQQKSRRLNMSATSHLVPLLIHGFLDKGAAWVPFLGALGRLSERALAPDFAGAGTRAREGEPFTLRRQAAEAVAFIDQPPDAPVVVVRQFIGWRGVEV